MWKSAWSSQLMPKVCVFTPFDHPGARDLRLLQEAARLGEVQALLGSDQAVAGLAGRAPRFPEAERLYFLQAVRWVREARIVDAPATPHGLPDPGGPAPEVWVVDERADHPAKADFCRARGIRYHVVPDQELAGFPDPVPEAPAPGRPRVLVTGCFDLFHTGHVRFFEEVSELGDLHVVVGHDRNIRLLKGEGHPLFSQEARSYLCGAIRFVKRAHVSSGDGWMDAEPEIARLQPDIYAVNEDGDKPEKRDFCRRHGLEYVVLQRTPKPGLAPRSSTQLRGFQESLK
jgi:cytidyltransferase-like protein